VGAFDAVEEFEAMMLNGPSATTAPCRHGLYLLWKARQD